jgi:hypothetical protein
MKNYYIGPHGEVRFAEPERDADGVLGAPEADAEYQAWLAEGNLPAPYIAPVAPAPAVVTMRQARLALLGAGLLQLVEDAIAGMPSPQKEAARIEWEYSQEVHRNRPFVLALSGALGLNDEQLDSLFLTASKL